MQAINILPRKVVPGIMPSPSISYEIAWQVDQPMSQVYTYDISKDFEPYWSTIREKDTYVYMRPAYPSVSLASHSSAYIAIQDVAMVQQCLQPENLTKQVKLKTKSALAFPMLNEGFGEHFLCNLSMLLCFLEPSLLVKVELQNITSSKRHLRC